MPDWMRVTPNDVPLDQGWRFRFAAGRIEVFARDRDGMFYVDPNDPNEVARQPAYGGFGVWWTKDRGSRAIQELFEALFFLSGAGLGWRDPGPAPLTFGEAAELVGYDEQGQ